MYTNINSSTDSINSSTDSINSSTDSINSSTDSINSNTDSSITRSEYTTNRNQSCRSLYTTFELFKIINNFIYLFYSFVKSMFTANATLVNKVRLMTGPEELTLAIYI